MKSASHFRHLCLTVYTGMLAWLAMPVLAESDEQALNNAYQQVLFHYFQGDNFTAASLFSRMEQAHPEALQRIRNPGIDPLLFKGTLNLALGQTDDAQQIFERVLGADISPDTRTLAWWLLGKTLFEKGLFTRAADAYSQVSWQQAEQTLEPGVRDDWIYQWYLAEQQSATEQDAPVQDWLARLSDQSMYAPYLQYNLAIDALNHGQSLDGTAMLMQVAEQSVARAPWYNPWWTPLREEYVGERAALQDRANLTLGYKQLQSGETTRAIERFQRVRLNSPDTHAAMLGYGWALLKQDELTRALAVWSDLSQREESDEFVLEAYLAAAYAFEQAQAPVQAMDMLQRGIERYGIELQHLNALRDSLTQPWLQSVASQSGETQSGAADNLAPPVARILLQDDVRRQLAALQQTLSLLEKSAVWRQQLDVFAVLLDEREQEGTRRIRRLAEMDTLGKLEQLKARRDNVATIINQAEQAPELLADEQGLQWRARLQRARQNIERQHEQRDNLGQAALDDKYQTRVTRLKGILAWQASEHFADRRWQASKQLAQLDEALAGGRQIQQRLQGYLQTSPVFPRQRSRVSDLQQRNQSIWRRLDAVRLAQLDALQQTMNISLANDIAQLEQYRLQAQQAIVRLQDDAYRRTSGQVNPVPSGTGD